MVQYVSGRLLPPLKPPKGWKQIYASKWQHPSEQYYKGNDPGRCCNSLRLLDDFWKLSAGDIAQIENQNTPFRFEDLPRELRDQIYEHHIAWLHESGGPFRYATQPPITQVSIQIRKESLQIFYGTCEFEIDIFPGQRICPVRGAQLRDFGCPTKIFMSQITNKHLAMIRKLKLNIPMWHSNIRCYHDVSWILNMGTNTTPPRLSLLSIDYTSKILPVLSGSDTLSYEEWWTDVHREVEPVLSKLFETIARRAGEKRLLKSDLEAVLEIFQCFPCIEWIGRDASLSHGCDKEDLLASDCGSVEFRQIAAKVIAGVGRASWNEG